MKIIIPKILNMRRTFKTSPNREIVLKLITEINVSEKTATLLAQRGIETFSQAKAFFRPTLDDLHNPYLMKDMDNAVNRIEKAIVENENILVFGDYDVDGTTAVALVYSYLKNIYSNVETYIPDRYIEGYGISYKGIDFAHDNSFTLIIALDCGIKSIEHIDYANQKNIDFIICDHHLPDDSLPNAIAVLDPKRKDCPYPYKELSGCGIGFKLIQALAHNRKKTVQDLLPYLDLVATAIAADIVPITGENRVLAYFGLQVINALPRAGIKALIQNIKKKKLSISDVVFIIAPRINAAGRIKHGNEAVKLLTEMNFSQAEIFAEEIEKYNLERRELDQQITIEAIEQIKENNEQQNYTTVVYHPNWHKGVIGIVASRLIESFYRPTVVFTKSGEKLAASARSVKDFDIYQALENCAKHLEQFGGHKYAAGMTLLEENYPAFKNEFEAYVKKTIPKEILEPEMVIDQIIDFTDINKKFISILKQFEPFGPENMTPIFMTKNVYDTGFVKTIGKNNEHLKMFLKQNNKISFSAIGFNLANYIKQVSNSKPFHIIYTIQENEFNGKITYQLNVKDIIFI